MKVSPVALVICSAAFGLQFKAKRAEVHSITLDRADAGRHPIAANFNRRDVPSSMPSSDEMDGIKGAMTNHEQFQDTLNKQLKSHDGHATAEALSYFIRGTDSQIDNAAATIANGLNKYTFGISGAIGDFLLGPFVQAVTDGAETVVSNVIGGAVDIVADGTTKLFSDALGKLSSLAVKNNVSEKRLNALNDAKSKLDQLNSVVKRDVPSAMPSSDDMDGVKGAMTNHEQFQDTLNKQLKSHDGHATAEALSYFIRGTDSQIDNAAATIANGLNKYTFGISGAIGDFLLGPFVQAVTDGAETVVSNVIGGAVDIVADGTTKIFSDALGKLSSLAVKNNVSEKRLNALNSAKSKLDQLNSVVKRDVPSTMPSSGDMDGVKGAMTNHEQFQDTLNKQLKSHDGHATAEALSYFIRGTDSQIDNAAATIANGLNKYTFGISGAIGDFLLGPFVQAVTDGAETVVSNVVGGAVDIVADGTTKIFSDALGKLSSLAVKNNVSEKRLNALNNAKAQIDALNG